MLTTHEILQELKTGKLSLDEAQEQLVRAKLLGTTTVTPSNTETEQFRALAAAIQHYLLQKLQAIFEIDAGQIDATENFMELGIDSTQLIGLVQTVESEVGLELYPTLLFEYQTIAGLATYLAAEYHPPFAQFLKIPGSSNAHPNGNAKVNPAVSTEPPRSMSRDHSVHSSLAPKNGSQIHLKMDHDHPRESSATDAIAVIGMAGVFPQSPDVTTFWHHLLQQTDLIREIPADHFDYRPWYDPTFQLEDTLYCKWGSFIDDVDKFDAGFFNISPREAEVMDPQLRYLLQILHQTAEDAGYGSTIRGSHTGVYVGACFHDYGGAMAEQGKAVQGHDSTGNAATMLANRPSFFFNLTGPSMAIDTACSSSLFALHNACQALQAGECEMAFAAGVNLILSSAHYRYFCTIGALSPTGRCHTFDARADGYVPGEAIAAVLLKPLQQAIHDGDQIYGIIKGSAVGHGGYTPSITAPSVDGEAKVLKAAWEDAGISPETLGYIEAHGTGTKLGDPIEIAALTKAFQHHTQQQGFCTIGSAKAHIGHTEGAAGITGVIKALLSLRHGLIPAMPQFETLNPYIPLDTSPFTINREAIPWPQQDGLPRRAGVSSFGFGGAYAHVVLERYASRPEGSRSATTHQPPATTLMNKVSAQPHVIVLSAKNEERLRVYAAKLLAFLEQEAPQQGEVEQTSVVGSTDVAPTMQAMVAELLDVDAVDIETSQTFAVYGFDAMQLNHLQTMVEEEYSCELPATLITIDTSVDEIAAYLISTIKQDASTNQAKPQSTLSLTDIAYTLQTGRETMEERLALVVSTVEELMERLQAYVQNQHSIPSLYQNNSKQSKATTDLLIEGESGAIFLQAVMAGQEWRKLAQLWVAGVAIDWQLLYPHARPQRVSLPTYPFAQERYWFDRHLATKVKESPLTQSISPPVYQASHTAEQGVLTSGKDKLTLQIPTEHAWQAKGREPKQGQTLTLTVAQPTEIVNSSEGRGQLTAGSSASRNPGHDTVMRMPQTQSAIEQQLRQQLVDLMYLNPEDIKAQQKLIDLGLDSITGVEWIKQINTAWGLNLPATTLYDYPTVERLAQYLAGIISVAADKAAEVQPIADTTPHEQEPQSNRQGHLSPIVLRKPETALTSDVADGAQAYGLVVSGVQSLDDIRLTSWQAPPPNATEVQIQVQASAINFPDTMCINGLYPTIPSYPFVPGFEVAGIVTAVGNEVSHFVAGDEVIALTGQQLGGHAHSVNVPALSTVRKPRNLTFAEACSLPVIFLTVYHAFRIANLAEGDHLLIQTAAGGCGLMAVQLANLRRAILYGTSSREEKLAFLARIGVDHPLNYTTDFDEAILALTEQRGVDVVLNMLGGNAIQKGLNVLAPHGRYVELAAHGLKAAPHLDLSRLVQNQAFYSIDGRRGGFGDAKQLSGSLNLMVQMVENEEICPVVHRIYPLAQIQDAFRYVKSGSHIGKVVISHSQAEATDLTDKCERALIRQRVMSRQQSAQLQAKEHTLQAVPSIHPLPSERAVDNGMTSRGNQHLESTSHLAQNAKIHPSEGIAVIGMSGRFPGAKSIDEFWQNIATGVDSIREVPPERWDVSRYYDPHKGTPGKSYSKWLGALDEIAAFDSLFFEISPREAELMDPQQRLFLEEAWKAIEDAGYAGDSLAESSCGVYVGASMGDYHTDLTPMGLEPDAYTLMGNSTAILAARLSYFLNLKGASLTIDTACSSSLVAIHEGCQSLLSGQNELVLAGGVCVLTGPQMHIMTSKAQMLAPDGRCKTFANQADGFGIAEGVGAVVLKRLADAERDGDHIYGIIKGSAINQDGATNGITAPSGNSQTALELAAYQQAGIDPSTIQLVEAHGTGTKLGDPIEIQALTNAFRTYTNHTGYCAIGSVKTNIGHALAASGIAGVIKALLALQYKQLPPSLHVEEPNEHIDFTNSPFFVNTELQDWQAAAGPRRAAVSSFGFSGTNAHLVLEEYQAQEERRQETEGIAPQLVVLSAKNSERLRDYAEKLQLFLKQEVEMKGEHECGNQERQLASQSAVQTISLTDIAYTLQVGRNAMDARLALVVSTIDELVEKLTQYGKQQTNIPGYYQGNVKTNQLGNTDILLGGKAGEAFLQIAIQERELGRLAQIWVSGVEVDWRLLHGDEPPRRISLPTYPFAKERYWITTTNQPASNPGRGVVQQLHPLIHQNISDLEEQRFHSAFTGDEFFLRDHQVQGKKVLPGVAYLEMARAAGELALRGQTVAQLCDVVWMKPLVVQDDASEIQIGLCPTANGEIAFEMRNDDHVHCRGNLLTGENSSPGPLEIAAIQSRCGCTLEGRACYDTFAQQGLRYGPTFQGIVDVVYNEHEALAALHQPTLAENERSGYGLHPSVMDAALQAILGLAASQSGAEPPSTYLPFAVQTVTIYAPTPAQGYAHVRYSAGVTPTADLVKYDITLTDQEGNICVTLAGFTVRAIPAMTSPGLLYAAPVWQAKSLDEETIGSELPTDVTLLLIGMEQATVTRVASTFTQAEVAILDATDPTDLVHQAWQHLRALVEANPSQPHPLVVAAADSVERHRYAPLAGLLKTARLEQPSILGKVLTFSTTDSNTLLAQLKQELSPESFHTVEVHYDETGTRMVQSLRELDLALPATTGYLRPQGVYWITGGLGGLGRLFAQHLLDHGEEITIILSGRSSLDDISQQQVAELNGSGSTVVYLQADVSVKADVERVVQTIREQYGALNGIVHSAGLLRDSLIRNKTEAEIAAVLAPKVAGTLHIDASTQSDELDFLVLFSSVAGVLGNVGQANYAAANAFINAFAHHRQRLVDMGKRFGHTFAINWSLWQTGGMTIDAETATWLQKKTGLAPLTTEQGLALFDALLTQKEATQLLVAQGNLAQIRQTWGLTPTSQPSPQPAIKAAEAISVNRDLQKQVEDELIELCATVLKVNPGDLDTTADLTDYGVDSILMMTMLNKLEERFGTAIAPTTIAEYTSIQALAGYLIKAGIATHAASTPVAKATANQVNTPAANPVVTPVSVSKVRQRFRSGKVAIIGQACRFPHSPSLEQFWENLATGRVLVTTIPAERWQAELFYNAQPGQRGKSYSNHGAFLNDIGAFDADFFGIRPEEAITMDPQQRIMLELAQELWDRAGYRADEVAGSKTSIFIGAKDNDYIRNHYDLIPEPAMQHTIVNSISNMIAARLSDFYDLTGTAQVIDTACSSSLVAIHDACQSILHGEAEMAIAGGIFLMIDASVHVGFSQAKVLSPDGKSYVFDERANGFVLGEGGGLVLLKEYDAAVRDGDQILGVILGSAVNNDGQTMGLTVPNQAGQQAVIAEALRRSQINAADIGYLEAHGTGTLLGDPIEIRAATDAYRQHTTERGYCAVGSVKSNLGHTMTAAGVTGLIKLVLSLQNRQIPPTLHCETPHPRFNFAVSPFYPNTQLQDWEPRNGRCVGAISSFGFGGTNCHLIVEEGSSTQQTRQPLPLTSFQRKHYWLGQEIVIGATNDNGFHRDEQAYNDQLLDQYLAGKLNEQDVAGLLRVNGIGG